MSIHGAIPSTSSPRAAGPGAVGAASDDGLLPVSPGTPPAVSIRDLARSYRAGIAGCSVHVEAVRAATLDIEAGATVGIVGPVGAGKSTLLLCMAGLLRPDRGTLAWFGRVADDAGRPPGVVYVPERATHYGFMTVREAIEHHVLLRDGSVTAGGEDTVAAAVSGAGLDGVADARIGELPWRVGPQLSVAQALAGRPRVLMLDETLSGLGPSARRHIVATLRTLALHGTAIVAAAATLEGLGGLASRVATMVDGCVSPLSEPSSLSPPPALELTVLVPAAGGRAPGSRVAEGTWERRVVRIPLEDTTPEAILSRCRACGIRVEGSRVVSDASAAHPPPMPC